MQKLSLPITKILVCLLTLSNTAYRSTANTTYYQNDDYVQIVYQHMGTQMKILKDAILVHTNCTIAYVEEYLAKKLDTKVDKITIWNAPLAEEPLNLTSEEKEKPIKALNKDFKIWQKAMILSSYDSVLTPDGLKNFLSLDESKHTQDNTSSGQTGYTKIFLIIGFVACIALIGRLLYSSPKRKKV